MISIYQTISNKIRGKSLFGLCVIVSVLLHSPIYISYFISILPLSASGDEKLFDAANLNLKDVDVDFIDLPASIMMGGDTNPAPVEKSEWVEGTGKDKSDAPNTDVNINKLSGSGTDEDGYMFAELSDHLPIAIVDFDPDDFFPEAARSANIYHKVVVVRFQVNEDGSVNSARVISKPAGYGFDEAAMKVAQKLRFRPGKVKGKRVKMLADQPISFNLTD